MQIKSFGENWIENNGIASAHTKAKMLEKKVIEELGKTPIDVNSIKNLSEEWADIQNAIEKFWNENNLIKKDRI